MPGGRPRKPTATHKLEGTYRADRHGDRNGEPNATGTPKKPKGLNEWGEWAWDQLVPQLTQTGVAKEIDSIELGEACRMFGYYRKACEKADANPMDKDIRIAVTSYWSAFDRIVCRFGLTPGDRIEDSTFCPA